MYLTNKRRLTQYSIIFFILFSLNPNGNVTLGKTVAGDYGTTKISATVCNELGIWLLPR